MILAEYYQKFNEPGKAIEKLLKAKDIAETAGDLDALKEITDKLKKVYMQQGDYKQALAYTELSNQYEDSLQKLGSQKDILLLQFADEEKRQAREAEDQKLAEQRRHNLQYMGITIGLAGVFLVLVLLGIFKVSTTSIRVLGFFAFIFLFEFIILITDKQIHHWTDGEPWKVLAIKIGLIAMLLPLHHWLEKRVVHYLSTKKIIIRTGKSLKKDLAKQEEKAT